MGENNEGGKIVSVVGYWEGGDGTGTMAEFPATLPPSAFIIFPPIILSHSVP